MALCPACGTQVDVLTNATGGATAPGLRCGRCGMFLGEAPPVQYLRAAVVDDSEAIRIVTREELQRGQLAQTVEVFADAGQFIRAVQSAAQAGHGFDLVLLDIAMPVVDGIKAGGYLRGVEQQYKLPPGLIVFFSATLCDARLSRYLQELAPAVYLNKGAVRSRQELPERLRTVLASARLSSP